MDNLTKVATVCARKFLEKKSSSFRAEADAIMAGAEAAAKRDELLKAIRGPGSSFPGWAKALLGIGGTKVVLDNVNKDRPTGWRR